MQAISPQPDTAAIGATRILEVRAVDANGTGVPGVEIRWQPAQAGDVIEPAVDTTDAMGHSAVTLRIGSQAGVHGVSATTPEFLSRNFFIHVDAAPLATLGLAPRQFNLIARQVVQVTTTPTDSVGNFVPAPLRWMSTNMEVATVDANGVVQARRPGTAVIYASATVPPFLVDSVTLQVLAATPARIEISPDTAGFVVGDRLRVTALAFDAAGRAIDAVDIAWTSSNPQMPLASPEVFADSAVIHVTATAPGVTLVQARIGPVAASALVNAVTDPLAETIPLANGSFCYAGLTFGRNGQFYYVSNEGGSFGPEDSLAIVRTGRAGAAWKKSAEFAECDRAYPLARNTISIDAAGNLYVPAKSGVLSLDALSGGTRWHARIGEVRGNIAIARSGVLVARRQSEIVALNAGDGTVLWRRAHPPESSEGGPVIDEERGVAYVAYYTTLTAIDLRTGATRWTKPRATVHTGQLAIANDGTVYVGAAAEIYAVTPAGDVRASHAIQGGAIGSPVIDAQGNVYVVTYDHIVYSFTAALAPRWQLRLTGGPYGWGSPSVTADGTLHFGDGSNLVAVRDGRLLWARRDVSGFLGQYWGFGFDNQLYAANLDRAYRFNTAGRDPQAQWPMTHGSPDRSATK